MPTVILQIMVKDVHNLLRKKYINHYFLKKMLYCSFAFCDGCIRKKMFPITPLPLRLATCLLMTYTYMTQMIVTDKQIDRQRQNCHKLCHAVNTELKLMTKTVRWLLSAKLHYTDTGQKFATSQHLDMSRCWALALRCGKFVVQQVVELLWACRLVVLYSMSVAGVRVVEFGTNKCSNNADQSVLQPLLMIVRQRATEVIRQLTWRARIQQFWHRDVMHLMQRKPTIIHPLVNVANKQHTGLTS